ncbi:PilN family type IVB pilus formation outer membrane protein [Pseudomonas chlororaphis]|uniref:PilN family type IVB pilus formation outer membrane protein n=1 Tax=Pseudomonas chlororaphis TaxID=587753 RepID=UPI0019286A83|nr:PilN family type IVB pilus formation outer membrane protein [Pseudomonas chlororaphis]QQX57542.1 PilN family type IVB pilus formation outer membrane protein [Pseudomonas chlororaphis subsp. aurantiaca]
MKIERQALRAIALGLLAVSLSSCSLKRVDESFHRSEATAGSASDIAANLRNTQAEPKRDTVVFSDRPWVNTQPIVSKRGLPPHKDCQFIWKPIGAVTLQQAAQEIISQCNLNVQITPDALNPAFATAAAPSTPSSAPPSASMNQDMASMLFPSSVTGASGSMGSNFSSFGVGATRQISNIKWDAKVSGFLDLITSRTGVSWRFDQVENAAVIYYLDTRTFRVYAFDDTTKMDSTVRSGMTTSTGTSGDSSSTGGSTSGISGDSGSNQTSNVSLKTSILNDIESSVKSMLTPSVGRMALSRATGTLTVTDRPEVLRRIEQTIKQENESITTQVILNVKVLSVTLTDIDQMGIDWTLVYKSLSNKWGISLKNVVPGIDPSAISGSVSILDTANSAWAGSSAMVQALAQQGRVSTVRSPSVTTLNLQSAPIQIGKLKSYLASSQVSNVAQVGSTTSLIPGSVTSGYNMTLLPFVMPENELLLKININMSTDPTFETVTSGESKAQFPSYGVQIFDQKVRLKNGETLVLSGFEQDSEDSTKSGTGDPGFFGLGGGRMRNTERNVIVVLITPVVMH